MRAVSCSTGRTTMTCTARPPHYVDKILKGTKPADLSVQQATKFEFIINLKAAKQIGLTIPGRVLERANQSDQVGVSREARGVSKTGSEEEMRRMLEIIGRLFRSHSDNRKSAIQNPKWLGFSIIAFMLVVAGAAALAQQAKKIPRIGYLSNIEPASDFPRSEVIRQALRELGYIEGQNIAIEYRYAEGRVDRLPALASELVRLKVDIIVVAGGGGLILAARNATKTIPIVMVGGGVDPVEAGFVESLAHPGGNVTGITNLSMKLGGKRLELLKEAVPKVARVAVLYDPANPGQRTRGERGSPSRGACAWVDYSTLGGTSCGRFREGICCDGQAAPGWTLRARRGPG